MNELVDKHFILELKTKITNLQIAVHKCENTLDFLIAEHKKKQKSITFNGHFLKNCQKSHPTI